MATDTEPRARQWYRTEEKAQQFQVQSVDRDSALIEIQYYNGDVDELDFDAWAEMEPQPVEPPIDWSGPVDDVTADDLGFAETGIQPEDWPEPVTPEQSGREKEIKRSGTTREDWGEGSPPEEKPSGDADQ